MTRAEVAIVGAGPAGLAAAGVLAAHSADVVLVDEQDRWGGQIYRQPPTTFTSTGHSPGRSQVRARTLLASVEAAQLRKLQRHRRLGSLRVRRRGRDARRLRSIAHLDSRACPRRPTRSARRSTCAGGDRRPRIAGCIPGLDAPGGDGGRRRAEVSQERKAVARPAIRAGRRSPAVTARRGSTRGRGRRHSCSRSRSASAGHARSPRDDDAVARACSSRRRSSGSRSTASPRRSSCALLSCGRRRRGNRRR